MRTEMLTMSDVFLLIWQTKTAPTCTCCDYDSRCGEGLTTTY